MRTFVVGDIHGSYRALLQCFGRSGFNYDRDRLIVLGDVCDGYPEVVQCINELMMIKKCDFIYGNHDLCALEWALQRGKRKIVKPSDGQGSMHSYEERPMARKHIDFLKGGKLWLKLGRQLFVHGGFNPDIPLSENSEEMLVWDRDLLDRACRKHPIDPHQKFGGYSDIFIGHTPTQLYDSSEPVKVCNVWALDTGAGWSGKLTIMNIKTNEYWQSDSTPSLYGVDSGRID